MKKFFLLFVLGAFASLSMAPFNFWPALFVGLSALYICVTKCPSWKKAGFMSFAFSFGYFCIGLSWIGNALLVEGNPYWWVWPLAVTGLPFILSLFPAVTCAIHKRIWKDANHLGTFLSFIFAIFAAEYLRGHLFTGFPWNLYGYTWIDYLEIAQIAALWNVYLLTLFTVIWATAPAYAVMSKDKKPIRYLVCFLIIGSFIASYIYGVKKLQHSALHDQEIQIVLIQPNIKQSEKWKQEKRASNFMGIIELSKYQKSENTNEIPETYIIVWPETAISQDLMNAPWAQNEIRQLLTSYPSEAFLVTGALRYIQDTKTFYNSIVIYNSNAEIINTYDKSHLVPFGEYIPFSNIFDVAPIVGFKGFEAGAKPKVLNSINNMNIGLQICYEVIFPNHFTKESSSPELIINATNDAWYGDSSGPYQHLVQARFRAIEEGAPLIRSANTGISAIIEPSGKIRDLIPLNKKAVVTANIFK